MNKSFFLVLAAVLCFGFSQAQEYSFGIKGGVNYATTGGTITGEPAGGNFGGTVEAESEIGFHGGAFFQLKFGKFFVRPEAMYNTIETTFEFPEQASVYAVEKFSIPLLFGYNIMGPIDIYAGPAYQNIMSSTLEGTDPENQTIVAQNTPLAAQVGLKFNLGRFELDLRYDHTLSSAETQDIDMVNSEYGINNAYFEDSRLNQVLLSIAFKIGDSEAFGGRRRGNCYF